MRLNCWLMLAAAGCSSPSATRRITLADQPLEWLGLPVSGTFDVTDGRPRGELAIRCVGSCRLGNDKAAWTFPTARPDDPLFGGGVPFSHLDIADLEIAIAFTDERATLTRWRWTSPDLDLEVSGTAQLGSTPAGTLIAGCIRYRPTDALLRRDPKTHALLSSLGADIGLDGMFHIRVEGTLETQRLTSGCP